INLSNVLEQEEQYAASVKEMLKAVALAPPRGDLYLMLGRKQDKAREYGEAIKSYREALNLDTQSVEAHYGPTPARRLRYAMRFCFSSSLALKGRIRDCFS